MTQRDNQPVAPGFAAVQKLRFMAWSCNGWADFLSNPVRAFEGPFFKMPALVLLSGKNSAFIAMCWVAGERKTEVMGGGVIEKVGYFILYIKHLGLGRIWNQKLFNLMQLITLEAVGAQSQNQKWIFGEEPLKFFWWFPPEPPPPLIIKSPFTNGAGNDFMDMFPNLVKAIFSWFIQKLFRGNPVISLKFRSDQWRKGAPQT